MNARWTVLLATVAALGAAVPAAAQGPAPATTTEAAPKKPRASRDTITREQIEASSHRNVFAVVQSIQPQWLRPRGAVSMGLSESVRVYRDGMPAGGVSTLRDIDVALVTSIRYLDGRAATERYGSDHGAGVILISTR